MLPSATRSSRCEARTTNLRIFTDQKRRVMSGITTCRRLPSGSIASTNGALRSTRRPDDFSIFSTRSRSGRRPDVGQRRQGPGDAALVIVSDDLIDQTSYRGRLGSRVEAATTYELADLALHHRDRVHDPPVLCQEGATYPPPGPASTPTNNAVDRAAETEQTPRTYGAAQPADLVSRGAAEDASRLRRVVADDPGSCKRPGGSATTAQGRS